MNEILHLPGIPNKNRLIYCAQTVKNMQAELAEIADLLPNLQKGLDSNNVVFREKVAQETKDVIEKFHEIEKLAEVDQYGLSYVLEELQE